MKIRTTHYEAKYDLASEKDQEKANFPLFSLTQTSGHLKRHMPFVRVYSPYQKQVSPVYISLSTDIHVVIAVKKKKKKKEKEKEEEEEKITIFNSCRRLQPLFKQQIFTKNLWS